MCDSPYSERIKKSLKEANLDFKGDNKEFERLWLEGFGALNNAIDRLPDNKDNFSDDERFFLLLMEKASQGLYDMYLSLRRRRYTAVRRDIRYIYEAFILLDKSVQSPDWASDIQEELREELSKEQAEDEKMRHSSPETTSRISNEASKLHKEIRQEEGMEEVFQLLGVSGSHPYNFESMTLDGKKNSYSEYQYLKYGTNFAYGLIGLFIMKFRDRITEEKYQELMDIMNDLLKLNDEKMFVFIWYFSDFMEEI